MKELSIEEKAKAYDNALEIAKGLYAKDAPDSLHLERMFPALKESKDERVIKNIKKVIGWYRGMFTEKSLMPEEYQEIDAWLEKQGEHQEYPKNVIDNAISFLANRNDGMPEEEAKDIVNAILTVLNPSYWPKQGEQKPTMIQWKGDNLKEVIDFTGVYKEGFEKWFHNSWEEYEKYVHEHNNIFKIFNEDGSHIEVPVGAWIVKTPDGYNTASRYVFKQKSTEWSKEDERIMDIILNDINYAQKNFSDSKLTSYDKKVDWLKNKVKSLRPQSHWKPSEEQMEALKDIFTRAGAFDDALLSLINDLEKLKN